jgi:hypothetical protein
MNNHDSMQIIKSVNKIKATCGVESEIASDLDLDGDAIDILYKMFLDIRETFNMINDIESKNITRMVDPVIEDREIIMRDIQNRYVTPSIQQLIINSLKPDKSFKGRRIQYLLKIDGSPLEYVVYFTTFDSKLDLDYLDMCAVNIFSLVHFLSKSRSRDCEIQRLELHIFLTPFKKLLPKKKGATIGPENVNSGMTRPCQKTTKIMIFREEEFMKLVLHETVHSLGIDIPHKFYQYYQERLDQIFSIDSTYNLNETYTEFWAVTINILFQIIQSIGPGDRYADDPTYIKQLIRDCYILETTFSRIQTIKVLDWMGLSIGDLVNESQKRRDFREDTHVFAYYILKYLLMENITDVLSVVAGHINFSNGLSDAAIRGRIDRLIAIIDHSLNINSHDFMGRFLRDERSIRTISRSCTVYRGIILDTLRMTAIELA